MSEGYNLKKVQEEQSGGFDALPENRYTVEVENVEKGKTKDGTKDMISVTLNVLGPTHAGRKLWQNFTLDGKAIIFVVNFLKAIGKESVADSENVTIDDIANAMEGGKCTVYAVPGKTPKGSPKNDLKNFKPIDEDEDASSVGPSEGTEKPLFK